MFELLTHFILPLIKLLYIPCDLLLGWTLFLGPIGALVAIGAVTGLLVNLFQKFCSNQVLLGQRKADLDKLKLLQKDAKQAGDESKNVRLRGLIGRISTKYAMESMKPALWSVPPMCVVAMWAGERMSFQPVRPGEVVEVVAHFEDGANGFTHILPNEGIAADGPAISAIEIPKKAEPAKSPDKETPAANVVQAPANKVAPAPAEKAPETPAGPQAHWRVRAEKEGNYALRVRHGEDQYELALPVYKSGGHPPEKAVVYRMESPTRDKMLALELKLQDTVQPAWWNLTMQWMGVYLLSSIAFGVGLRRVMGIQ
jgi:uncharacterized membrane protein (DUF106 family)